jgi:hypothetical protein
MGAWSVDVLGGDTPMDALDEFEDVLSIDRGEDWEKEGLYPLALSDAMRDLLRARLEDDATAASLLDACGGAWCEEDQQVWLTVLGAMYLVTGAAMQDGIREATADAAVHLANNAEAHGWLDVAARRSYMNSLAAALRGHQQGQIHDIGHVGLFEKMAGHSVSGLVNEKILRG